MLSTDTAVILDNYAAHKHAKMRRWLTRYPRWTFHFTPISCSWLNTVETLFATLTKRRLKRGVFPSVVALQEAINTSSRRTTVTPSRSSGKPIPVSMSASAARRTRSPITPVDTARYQRSQSGWARIDSALQVYPAHSLLGPELWPTVRASLRPLRPAELSAHRSHRRA